ncbi:MAG: SH3 domain-containing protein [Paludibacteraceae bacterium]|nr:SH3 domain-containing protein [Paludibacteraceae bacterium]
MKYIVTTKDDGPLGNLHLRQLPNTTSEILASIPKGSVIESNSVLMQVEGWTAVNYAGKSGYVSNQYISVYDEKKTTPVVPSNIDSETTVSESEGTSKVLIAGIVVAAVGAIMKVLI